MRVREMRELTGDELVIRITDTRRELLELRFQHASRKLENPAKLRLARKRLAKLLTVQHESKVEKTAKK